MSKKLENTDDKWLIRIDADLSKEIPREKMTPTTTAIESIREVSDLFVNSVEWDTSWSKAGDDPAMFFTENIFIPAIKSPLTNSDAVAKKLLEKINGNSKEENKYALLDAILVTVEYAADAIKAENFEKNISLAWSYAASAQYWAGTLSTVNVGEDIGKWAASNMAQIRHKENYALAEDVKRFWRENIDPSISAQKAAEKIIQEKVVPLSHKKIAEIISRLRKSEGLRKT